VRGHEVLARLANSLLLITRPLVPFNLQIQSLALNTCYMKRVNVKRKRNAPCRLTPTVAIGRGYILCYIRQVISDRFQRRNRGGDVRRV
jgi:hypothetical protein